MLIQEHFYLKHLKSGGSIPLSTLALVSMGPVKRGHNPPASWWFQAWRRRRLNWLLLLHHASHQLSLANPGQIIMDSNKKKTSEAKSPGHCTQRINNDPTPAFFLVSTILNLHHDVAVCGVGQHDTTTILKKNGAGRGYEVASRMKRCRDQN